MLSDIEEPEETEAPEISVGDPQLVDPEDITFDGELEPEPEPEPAPPPPVMRAPEAAPRPNVIVISLDCLRGDHTTMAGYRRDTTPNIARYAAGGLVCDYAIATGTNTGHSFSSMLRSSYMEGIFDRNVLMARLTGANKAYIDQQIPHLAALMCASPEELLAHAELVVVGNGSPEFVEALEATRPEQVVLDLVRVPADFSRVRAEYHGLCW